jgi:hypothetical protein
MRSFSVIAAGVALVTTLTDAHSQRVSGVVLDSIASAPVGGTVVMVLDSSGVTTARAIADSAGRFSVILGPRAERLRVLHIGYRPQTVLARQALDTPLELRLARIPPMLDAVQVNQSSLCPGSADRGIAFDVLEQVRAGLFGQVASTEAGAVQAEGVIYRRALNVTNRLVEGQVMEARTGRSLRPFVAIASPKTFAERGYMTEDASGARTFGALDADVLLDESFAATHCFRLAEKDSSHPDEIGLAFTPVDARRSLVDVTGVVWIEKSGRELRSIDFQYTNLEPAATKVGAGGHIAFRTAPNGQSFIEQWRVTLPVLTPAPNAPPKIGQAREFRTDLRVSELRENGGMVLSAKWDGGTKWVATGTGLAGTVRIASSGRGASAAIVTIDGSAARAVTDSAGAFAIAPLPSGRYKVTASDTTFAAFVKPRTTTMTVDVASGSVASVALRVDQADTIRVRALARAAALKVRTIMGTVSDSGRQPLQGAEVRIRGGASVVTSADGKFRFVDAPLDAVLLEIRRVGFAPALVGIPTGGDTSLTLRLGPIAQELEAVKVSAALKSERLRVFEERMHARDRGAGGGFFITAADIERRAPAQVTSIFDNIPGIYVLRVGQRNFSIFGDSRSMSGPVDQKCEATVFLDGIKLQSGGDYLKTITVRRKRVEVLERGVAIDQLVLPSNIAGIEVYASANTAPTQYQAVNNGCSIVLIWTKG